MDYNSLTKTIFQLTPQEVQNKLHKSEYSLDLALKPFYIDTEKHFHLVNYKYYLSIHKRYKPVQLHTHSTCEINYIYQGSVTQWIDGKKYILKSGDIVVLDKLVPHAIDVTEKDDVMVNLQMFDSFFSGDFIKQFTQESLIATAFFSLFQERDQMNYLIFNTQGNDLIRQTINNMLIEHFNPRAGSKEMIKAYMLIFFGELLRSTEYYVDREFSNYSGGYYIPDILKYIEDTYQKGSLKEAASTFSISTIHLSRLLKKYLGKTYKQLVHEKRIAVAYRLILSSNLPIYEIAGRVGYSNLNTFNQKFREVHKILPGAVREC